jgi:hypothetical protein
LPALSSSPGDWAGIDPVTDILTVTEGSGIYQQILAGTYAEVSFRVAPDDATGTLVTMEAAAPCFAAGCTAPVIWIGRGGSIACGIPRGSTPDRAVFVDHVLTPVKYLVNCSSVACLRVAEVIYFHV